ncbi:MAG: HD domain-containing protein, partial [Geminicoccaceae bacterium]
MSEIGTILDFLALAERLKCELRHSWLSNGRQESVAEHSWQMALMAMLMHRRLEVPVDLGKTLRMILTHDLVEAEVGDVPFFDRSERKATKAARERAAIELIRTRLGGPVGQEIYDLWHEYEAKQTAEAKFAGALDHLEVQAQHNLAHIRTWTPIEYDLV